MSVFKVADDLLHHAAPAPARAKVKHVVTAPHRPRRALKSTTPHGVNGAAVASHDSDHEYRAF